VTTDQIIKKYGKPNETGAGYLVTIDLPYPMRLSWDTKVVVKRMVCHKLIAAQLKAVLQDILLAYGYEKIKDLGIDLFGGCFNYRKMRGGTSWSLHSWGIAIDLDPERNALKTPFKDAQFSKPEYAQLHAIFEKHGFENLGKTRNMDAMHFQVKE
jgi:hypothetical protein